MALLRVDNSVCHSCSRAYRPGQPAAVGLPRLAYVPTSATGYRQGGVDLEQRRRARDLGIELGFYPPGPLDAITDVPGVLVGHTTLDDGDSVRTGVTAVVFSDAEGVILPNRIFAGAHVFSGTGELTGLRALTELGFVESPVVFTNTLSVPTVRAAVQRYLVGKYPTLGTTADAVLPIVGECDDSYLNDMLGLHISEEHVLSALETASTGPVAEGCVGAGMGMVSFEFKAGVGTASRRLPEDMGGYTLGCIVVANMGARRRLSVDGVPIGREITDLRTSKVAEGSAMVLVATDAPLLPQQLAQLARRAGVGLGRIGSYGGHGSGEFVVAVSTAAVAPRGTGRHRFTIEAVLPSRSGLDPLFEAAVETCEEALLNSLLMACTVVGRKEHVAYALPIDRMLAVMRRYGR